MKKEYENFKKLIFFGSGQIGKDALDLLGTPNVAFFVDNAVQVENAERKWDIEVIPFEQYRKIHKDYITIITTNQQNKCQIAEQLLDSGINKFLYIEEISEIFNFDIKRLEKDAWKEKLLQTIKKRISLKQDTSSDVEFYLVDSFEISHFLPLYYALIEKNLNVRFVAEPSSINSAGRWFDYQKAVTILQRKRIDYSTLRNPNAKLAFTTQFAGNLKYYNGLKCQITYGTAIMKEKAFQLKREVAEKFDYIFVHGKLQKELISKWIPSSHIIDMSYPKYLKDFDSPINKFEILSELNIKTTKPIVGYYPTWDEYSSILEYEKAFTALRDEFFIVSKPHHCLWRFKDRIDALYRCSDLVLDDKYDLYKAAKITDCAVCDAKSGVVTELAFLNSDIHMAIIYCNSTSDDFYIDLDKFALEVKEPSMLHCTIKDLLNKDNNIIFRKDMVRQMYSPDIASGINRSVKKICELIE